MGKADSEGAKSIRGPAVGRNLVAEAGWVDKRHDSQRSAAVRQIDTTNASIVLNEHAQEVLIGDALGVAGRLHTSHHELVLWRNGFHDTLLLLLINNFVLDFAHIELHGGFPISDTGSGSLDSLVNKPVVVCVTVATSADSHHLLDIETDSMSSKLTVLIVDLDMTICDFVGEEDVLFENRAHRACSLIDAAPSLDVAGLRLSITDDHVDWLLTEDHDLFVLHLIVLIMGLKDGLDIVLDFRLGLLTRVLMLEVEGGGDVVGEFGLEVNLVNTWLEHTALDVEHAVLVLKEFLAVLELVGVMDGLIAILSGVVTDERALFSTFDLEFNVGCCNSLHNLEVDDTGDGVARLVEGVLGLELNLALGELTPFI